ncbi:hypothetical protein F4859DRAFT_476360 [Xylaria cf. heliscus]|nr:hypothetical protein F4859DRAFT_476360 [Xylaria cf. heliscus]
MAPRCRRSARIASASKRSKDSPAPQQLMSVAETHDTYETPSKAPSRAMHNKVASSPMPVPAPATPSGAAPLKLAMSEMHPSKVHQTMGPPSSGLRNGFTDIDYTKTPMQTLIQNTPSKTPVPSSDFTFRSTRPANDRELGPEARKLMDSLRDEAAAIKVQLAAERARERADERKSSEGRKIAAAKGKSGRFSVAHMAEFKKMDSIEGHASSFRAAPGRFTPVKATAAAAAPVMPITPLKPGIKRSQSKANLDEPDSAHPKTVPPRLLSRSIEKILPPHGAKRVRQHKEDDASTRRPISRDGTSIPRPKSSGNDSLSSGIPRSQTLGNLMTPTKSSLARTNSLKSPTISLVRSPSQPDLQKINSFSAKVGTALARSPSKPDLEPLARSPSKKHFGLKWGSSNNSVSESSSIPSRIETPGRFGRIKSILKRQPSGTKPKSGIPQLSASATKTPIRPNVTESMFPSVPLTTPGQKHNRHVDFTPETKKAAMAQNSPSPVKTSIPRSTTLSKLPAPKFTAGGAGVANQKSATGEVTYPDLSAYQVDRDEPEDLPESVPGTFTFRSDHTIQVENSPSKGFGSAAGQASLRQVRKSTVPSTQMPGSFPHISEVSPNKENDAPFTHNGIPHGMSNKKRHRASSDEDDDDDEGSKRGVKKLRKNPPVAEGHALVAPRLIGQTSPSKKPLGSTPQTPSTQKKKKTGLSLSRLQMLAQPKIRK